MAGIFVEFLDMIRCVDQGLACYRLTKIPPEQMHFPFFHIDQTQLGLVIFLGSTGNQLTLFSTVPIK